MNQQNFDEDLCTDEEGHSCGSKRDRDVNVKNNLSNIIDHHGGKSSSSEDFLLPPMLPEHQGRHTLVLDMEGTILTEFSEKSRGSSIDFALQQEATGVPSFIKQRPYLQQFLQVTSNIYEIVIFTELSKVKADTILDNIVANSSSYITHRLYRESCREIDGKLVKDISSLGRDMRKVLIVDDCIFRYSLQPCNSIPITRYEGDPYDEELQCLFDLLLRASTEEDVKIFLAAQFPELQNSESGVAKLLADHIVKIGIFSSRLGPYLSSDLRQRGKKNTLVLDMDQTLLKESWEKLPIGSDYFTVYIDSELGLYSVEKLESESLSYSDSESVTKAYVYPRPGLKEFLLEMSRVFQIVIFTMSTADRATVLLDEINYEKCISIFLARDFRSTIQGNSFKELQFLGLNIENVVFIDDLSSNCDLYPSNSIQINAFEGHGLDRELTKLIPFLRNVSELDDVRPAIQARHDLPVRAIPVEDD